MYTPYDIEKKVPALASAEPMIVWPVNASFQEVRAGLSEAVDKIAESLDNPPILNTVMSDGSYTITLPKGGVIELQA